MRKIYNFFLSDLLLLVFGQFRAQDFFVTNIGSNLTVFIKQGFTSYANFANTAILYTNDTGELQCSDSF